LISVDELLGERSSPHGPHLLDVRWKLGGPPGDIAYADGHLPGAIFVDLDRDLTGEWGPGGAGGRHPLPAAAAFQSAMRALGVHDHQPVVVYDGDDSTAAARAWWLLRYFGHPSVRVLDGGFRAWQLAGLTPEAGPPAAPPLPGTFTAQPGHLPLLDAGGAAALAREGVLLDARAAQRYRGEVEPVASPARSARRRRKTSTRAARSGRPASWRSGSPGLASPANVPSGHTAARG
jgi:thiosulfate/3-mercaptopyruvate sulfurtransferase